MVPRPSSRGTHLLTAAALWAAASIPLALCVGRVLHRAGRRHGVAEEAESYLRRADRPSSILRRGSALAGAALLAVTFIGGTAAVRRLPPVSVIVGEGGGLTIGTTTSTTVADAPKSAVPTRRSAKTRSSVPRRQASPPLAPDDATRSPTPAWPPDGVATTPTTTVDTATPSPSSGSTATTDGQDSEGGDTGSRRSRRPSPSTTTTSSTTSTSTTTTSTTSTTVATAPGTTTSTTIDEDVGEGSRHDR